jgi:hypothetical protein
MFPHRAASRVHIFAFAAVLLLAGPAAAQDPRQNQPGKFDFYMLSLSGTASFCAAAGMRAARLPVRGPWPVAAIRERISGILPAAGTAARLWGDLLDARLDAGAAPHLQ